MGGSWVAARDAAHAGDTTARPTRMPRRSAEQFDRFTDYLALGLEQDLGVEVVVAQPNRRTSG